MQFGHTTPSRHFRDLQKTFTDSTSLQNFPLLFYQHLIIFYISNL